MCTDSQLPVIDLNPELLASKSYELKLSKDFKNIFTNLGFSYIINHGIPEEILKEVFRCSYEFHSLSVDKKMKINLNKFYRGYMPLGTTTFESAKAEKFYTPNQSESFIFVNELDDPYQITPDLTMVGQNQWPQKISEFKHVIYQYNFFMNILAKRIMKILFQSFGHNGDCLEYYIKRPFSSLRLQCYPVQPKEIPKNQFGIAPHTDYGFITLLAQDDVGGLEIQTPANNWITVRPKQNALILNTGDMIKILTNGQFVSTAHRVINKSNVRRFSIPFFFSPNMSTEIGPLEIFCTKKNPAQFKKIKFGEYLNNKLKSTYMRLDT